MTVISESDPRIVYMKRDKVLDSTGFCFVLKDKWLVVHPETGDLVFWQDEKKRIGKLIGASPQCNSNYTVADHIRSKMFPWANIELIERVAQPIEIRDYV